MKKFLVLYQSSVPASEQMAKSSPEQATVLEFLAMPGMPQK